MQNKCYKSLKTWDTNGLNQFTTTRHRPDACEETVDTQTSSYITGDPAFAVDRRGIITLWNEAAEKSFGFSSLEALGKRCWRLLSGKDTYGNRYCCRHCPVREMAFRNEPINSFQSVYKTSSDQPKQFTVSCITIFDKPKNKILLHVCRPENDLTEAVNIEPPARAPVANPPGALSQREVEILSLLADKMSTQDIAKTLSISIRTVRTHIQHLMYKLQVHKRVEAIQAGKRLKLIY